jgi:hypothetical protein
MKFGSNLKFKMAARKLFSGSFLMTMFFEIVIPTSMNWG